MKSWWSVAKGLLTWKRSSSGSFNDRSKGDGSMLARCALVLRRGDRRMLSVGVVLVLA